MSCRSKFQQAAYANGFFNFGAANLWHRAIASRAKIVVVEISTGLPYLHGVDNGLHISEVDYLIEGDPGLPPELPNPPPCDADRAVAQRIAAEVDAGACLQVGIGDTKNLDRGKIVCSFALGSHELYRIIDRNTDFLCCPVEYTNLPHVIMQNERVVAINNTTQMDLQGQASSESCGHRHISGTGGQLQFVRGAYASKGGKSFVCLSSIYERHGIRKSRIVLNLTPGNMVTTPRSDMMYVVTEFGMVNLKGMSVPERAHAMISLAHPDFRDELGREAREHGLIPVTSRHMGQGTRQL